jgi:DNA-binding transcriptional regulator YbjK
VATTSIGLIGRMDSLYESLTVHKLHNKIHSLIREGKISKKTKVYISIGNRASPANHVFLELTSLHISTGEYDRD